MMTLATITEQDIDPDAPVIDRSNFSHRQAVRAVVLDAKGRVALLNVRNKTYHKLPGGGIDDGEDMLAALERELLEEIGCRAEIIAEIGTIHEYRDQWQEFQESYCYLARLVGEQQANTLTEKEQSEGFEPMWAANIDAAIAILAADSPEDYAGKYIRLRDGLFLRAALQLTPRDIISA